MTYVADADRYQKMAYRRCGRSGIDLPSISLGLWQNFGGVDNYEVARAMLRRAFDRGVCHFDLANNYGPPYGSAEENFGHIFAADFRPYRDELFISTKAGWDMWPGPYGNLGSRKYLVASLDQSLKRMGLDYVDLFYHHRPDPDTPLEETMGALAAIVQSGQGALCRHLAVPARGDAPRRGDPEGAGRAAPHPPAGLFDAQPLDRGRPPRCARRGRRRLHLLLAAGAGAAHRQVSQGRAGRLARGEEPLRCRNRGSRRTWSARLNKLDAIAKRRGQSLAQLALVWVLRHKGVTSALIGARTVAQLDDSLDALKAPDLSSDEVAEIDRILA